MHFEIFDGYFSNVAAMAVRLDEFESARLSRMSFFMLSEHSLSRECFFGTIPAALMRFNRTRYARSYLSLVRFLMGSTRMALLSTSTMTMMYCIPLYDVMPKRPV